MLDDCWADGGDGGFSGNVQVTPEEETKRTEGEARVAAETNQRGWQVINTSDFSLFPFQVCLKGCQVCDDC